MNKSIFLLLFLSCVIGNAQQKIKFSYDTAGNQISRILCINCDARVAAKGIEEVKDQDLEKFYPEDLISYYPNPVKEELYLKWELINENQVSSIQVFSINGQSLNTYKKTANSNEQIIPFQSYPTGLYLVVLNYANGEQQTIKIKKQ